MLIPLGEALQETGATMLIAVMFSHVANDIPLWSLIALVVMVSMLLSDVIHNTPTAVLMSPIAYGHQSNTLVMGPGNYKFSDYWRLGLPLDIVILCSSVPMILWVWS